jgi:hypothetical protein
MVARLRASGGPSHDLLVLLDQHQVMNTGQLARQRRARADGAVPDRAAARRRAGRVRPARPASVFDLARSSTDLKLRHPEKLLCPLIPHL